MASTAHLNVISETASYCERKSEVKIKPQMSVVALDKSYKRGPHTVNVLQGVNIKVYKGDFVSVVGQSGSGKSTLLHLMGLLDKPDVGEILLNGDRIDDLPSKAKDKIRNRVFGFVFQFYHLIPEMTLLENVLSPLMIRYSTFEYWKRRTEFANHAREMIARVGLEHRIKHRPNQLSGGEMQRAAIARALVAKPEIVLADEPTGNLDSTTGNEIIDLLESLNHNEKLTIVMVTHDNQLAHRAQQIVRLTKGRLEYNNAEAA
jgi:lipoprotein-releasing system ATP-binding protein